MLGLSLGHVELPGRPEVKVEILGHILGADSQKVTHKFSMCFDDSLPSPSISIFWIQTSIGVWPSSERRLEWSWILIGASGGGGRDSESVQAY
jgi:hypothetical protein